MNIRTNNTIILICYLTLVAYGLIMIGSATSLGKDNLTGAQYILKQLIGVIFGSFFAYLLQGIRFSNRITNLLFCFLSVVLVFLPVLFGREIGGARRWIDLGFINFQPGEFSKVSYIIFLSFYYGIARVGGKAHLLSSLVTFFVLIGFYLQKDLGSIFITLCIYFVSILLVIKNSLKISLIFFPIGVTLLVISIISEPYRWQRIKSFLNPEADPLGSGYQVIQSLDALRSGGLTGKGLGRGDKKLGTLPAAHTDFILAVTGEELGFLGCILALMLLFGLSFGFLLRSLYFIQLRTASILNLLTALYLGLHGILNTLVVVGYLPTKGLPFPFLSYAGSSSMAFSFLVVFTFLYKWQ